MNNSTVNLETHHVKFSRFLLVLSLNDGYVSNETVTFVLLGDHTAFILAVMNI